MNGLERIQALPPEQRTVAKRLLIDMMVARFDENRHISEETMRYALGFNRADLLTWYRQAYAEVISRREPL
jgi:hypothetical protein